MLLTEYDLSGLVVHAVYDRQRFDADALGADQVAALLESLFYGDTDTFNSSTCALDQVDEAVYSASVGPGVINDQYMVIRSQILGGDDHIIDALVGEGFDLGSEGLSIKVDAMGLFGKDNRNMEALGCDAGDPDAGSLYCEDLVDRFICEQPLEFFSHCAEQIDIHLVIQKIVDFQNIAGFDESIFENSFFQ